MSQKTIPLNTIFLAEYSVDTAALNDKTILITGSGDGLGKSLALELARHAATIILLDKSVKKLEAVYDEIEQAGGAQPAIFPMDLEKANEQDYQQLAVAIHDNFGQLNGLILNAVTIGQHSPVVNIDLEQWSRSLQINLTANFLLLKHCSGVLNKASEASVIYVSDAVARHGKAYWGTYSTTKAACLNLIQTLSDEWESNTQIHLNSIDTGPLQTGLRRQAFPGEDPRLNPEPDRATKPFIYFMDPGIKWPSGKHFTWDVAAQSLTEN